ncbi:hypothetical protein D3C87_2143100 [compost metagenome]
MAAVKSALPASSKPSVGVLRVLTAESSILNKLVSDVPFPGSGTALLVMELKIWVPVWPMVMVRAASTL